MTQGFPGGAGVYATASLAAMTSIAPEQSGTSESEAVRGPARWTSLQKIGFRVLFTVGGGILLLSVYDNLGLFGLFEPVLWLSAQIGSFLIRGHGIELTVSSGATCCGCGATTWGGLSSRWQLSRSGPCRTVTVPTTAGCRLRCGYSPDSGWPCR